MKNKDLVAGQHVFVNGSKDWQRGGGWRRDRRMVVLTTDPYTLNTYGYRSPDYRNETFTIDGNTYRCTMPDRIKKQREGRWRDSLYRVGVLCLEVREDGTQYEPGKSGRSTPEVIPLAHIRGAWDVVHPEQVKRDEERKQAAQRGNEIRQQQRDEYREAATKLQELVPELSFYIGDYDRSVELSGAQLRHIIAAIEGGQR